MGHYKDFVGIIDIVAMETVTWSQNPTKDGGKTYIRTPLSSDSDSAIWDRAVKARNDLVDQVR